MNFSGRSVFFMVMAILIIAVVSVTLSMKESKIETVRLIDEPKFIETNMKDLRNNPVYKELVELKSSFYPGKDDVRSYLEMGTMCADLGLYASSVNYYSKSLDKNKDDSYSFFEAHNMIGFIDLEHHKVDDAIERIKLIERNFPGVSGLYDVKGTIGYKNRQYKSSEKDYMGEFINSTCTDASVGLGNIYFSQNDDNEAIRIYRTGSVFDPGDSLVITAIGIVHYERGSFDEAEKYFYRAAELDPFAGKNYSLIGDIERQRKNYKKAFEYFQKALDSDAMDRDWAYGGMGTAWLDMAEINRDLIPFDRITLALIILLLLVVNVAIFLFEKKAAEKNKEEKKDENFVLRATFKTLALWILTFVLLYFLAVPNNPMQKRTLYSLKARNAFINAIDHNPNRRDLYQGLAASYANLRELQKMKDALEEAKKLPEFDLHRKLKFPF